MSDDRFWSKVDIRENNECWEWKAYTINTTGYGKFWNGYSYIKAHRHSWELVYGPIPEGKLVLHTCDNRICVNPNHLYLGTHSDNNLDRSYRNPNNQGGENPVLYNGEIWLIRRLNIYTKNISRRRYKFSISYVSKMFKVSRSTIYRIWSGEKIKCREGYYV